VEYILRVKRNVKAILNLTPNGRILTNEMRKYQSFINCSTIIWMDNWPEEGFREVGKLYLEALGTQN
jgi:dynein heavy chain